jgi:hypothetical protein
VEKKKVQHGKVLKLKRLTLSKETIYLLESADLAQVFGGTGSRSLCAGTAECCDKW